MTDSIEIEASKEKFKAELADNILKKSWGLSMRNKGKMFFVFSRPGRPPIDMMLVQTPLHLYFLDESGEVIDRQYAEPWTLDPRTWRLYRPSVDAKYLLESFEQLDIEEGDKVSFDL